MKHRSDQGQTLIALLIFMMLAITITVTAATITVINTQANNSFANGNAALSAANSGVENALLQLERNPAYTGETMTINSTTTATITISGTTTVTITSVGKAVGVGTFVRTIIATATYSNNTYSLTSWIETP